MRDPERLLGQIGLRPEEQAALAGVKAWGFEDVLRYHQPEPGQSAFWYYRVKEGVTRGKNWRVDPS